MPHPQSNSRGVRSAAFLVLAASMLTSTTAADDWPCWRGPLGTGISSESTAPLNWGPSDNIAWKTEIPGRGRSSPIVSKGRVFLTTGLDEDQSRRIVCLDQKDGKSLWSVAVHHGPGGKMHQDNTTASSTPATDGERVYAAFVDDQGMKVVAVDFDGKVVWSVNPGTFFSNHGFAASPVLYGDGLIVNGHQDGTAFIVMLDRVTGKEVWRYTPAVNQRSFSTPVLTTFEGQKQLVVTGSQQTLGLNPADGSIIWSAQGPTEKFVCTPSVGHGMVFSFGGSPDKKSLAVRLGGRGDVTDTHVAWRSEQGMPYVPSPILVGNYLHVITDLGVYSCIDPVSGEVLHKARAGGSTYSSPVSVADRIYIFEDTGRCTVVKNEPGFQVLARNELTEEVYTSPAVAEGQIFIRTASSLVCIGETR